MTQLNAFLAVIRGGSVTAAADELVVTQPSVSSAIAALGRELGCELFERAGRGIRLTESGTAFAAYAADVIGLLEQGREAAREAAAVAGRRLRIVAVTTAAESFVPPLMRAFQGPAADVELALDVGNREYVFSRVLDHAADVAISGTPPVDARLRGCAAGCQSDRVHHRPRRSARCTTATGDTGALGERPWLLREPGSGTRTLGQQFLEAHGLDATDADARLQRCDQAGRARRVGDLAGFTGDRRVGARLGSARRDRFTGPADNPLLVRGALGGRASAPARHRVRRVRHRRGGQGAGVLASARR